LKDLKASKLSEVEKLNQINNLRLASRPFLCSQEANMTILVTIMTILVPRKLTVSVRQPDRFCASS
jgi:hypothetical protein